jgi:hypothetical protein
MQSLNRLNRITELLSRFKTEIEIANAHGYTDLNREAQNLLKLLFKAIFQLPHLQNLDVSERHNHPGIDLADDTKRWAFQITSERTSEKIKETLEKFKDHDLNKKYDRLIIYILKQKQQRYQTDFSKSIPASFQFDKKRDILDYTDLLPLILRLSDQDQQRIWNLLEENFSDPALQNKEWYYNRLPAHKATFVNPSVYHPALSILRQHGIVILTGPPHIGKTETGFALLLEVSEEKGFGSIVYLPQIDDWSRLLSVRNRAILLDDPFGASIFDSSIAADRFEDLIRLANDNLIVITSRQGILDAACKRHRIGQTSTLSNIVVELQQEGAYDDVALNRILGNHIRYAQASSSPNGVQLSEIQAQTLLKSSAYIIWHLRFPHNIERLVNVHARTLKPETNIDYLVDQAKDIKRVVQQWYKELDRSARIFSAILALFPHNLSSETQEFYNLACCELNIQSSDLQRLTGESSGYIRFDAVVDFAHPSYAEGVITSLQTDDLDLAWDLLRIRARYALRLHINSLIQCKLAVRLLGQDHWQPSRKPSPRPLSVEEYFSQFASAYNLIIEQNFPSMRASFQPKWSGEARIHVDTSLDGSINMWSCWRHLANEPLVSISVNKVHFGGHSLSEMDVEARDKYGHLYPVWHSDPDVEHSIPEIAALNDVSRQLTDATNRSSLSKSEFLSETWHLRMARLLVQLEDANFPVEELSDERPLTEQRLKEWVMPYVEHWSQLSGPLNKETLSEITEWPPKVSFKSLFIPDAKRDIEILQAEGHPITGGFLVPPDLAWESVGPRAGGSSFSDVYTDDQLLWAARTGIRLIIEAYKSIVELNFPSMYKQLWLYSNLPVKITCVLDREELLAFARPSAHYGITPLGIDGIQDTQIDVHLISTSVSTETRKQALSVRGSIYEGDDPDCIIWGGISPGSFFRLKDWRKEAIDLVMRDLKECLGDSPWGFSAF